MWPRLLQSRNDCACALVTVRSIRTSGFDKRPTSCDANGVMSRTSHDLRSEQWYGGWSRMFRLDKREASRQLRHKREQDRARVDGRMLMAELEAEPPERFECIDVTEDERQWYEWLAMMHEPSTAFDPHDDGYSYDWEDSTDYDPPPTYDPACGETRWFVEQLDAMRPELYARP